MTQDTGTTTTTAPSKEQTRHIADAITAEVARIVAKKAKANVGGDDLALLQKVATNATTFALTPAAADGDAKAQKAATRKLDNLNAQLANIESIGASITTQTFWQVVKDVIGRMSTFAVDAAVKLAVPAVIAAV